MVFDLITYNPIALVFFHRIALAKKGQVVRCWWNTYGTNSGNNGQHAIYIIGRLIYQNHHAGS